MVCTRCNTPQDPDARFCTECGAQLGAARKSRSAYRYALLLLPVILLACAIGYYKYFLPQGIAAVVNGEEITRAELDQEVSRIKGSGQPTDAGLRYQALNALITERVMLQEARRAGADVSSQELAAAIADLQLRSGIETERFNRQAEAQYGSIRKFEDAVRRRLIINKYITAQIIPSGADQQAASRAIEQWVRKTSDAASVRVTLAEQWSAAGCGCAAKNRDAAPAADGCRMAGTGCRMAKNQSAAPIQPASSKTEAANKERAAEAGLAYWHQKHGSEAVEAKVTDYGCHLQVDIIKDNKTIDSLRYQNGSISE